MLSLDKWVNESMRDSERSSTPDRLMLHLTPEEHWVETLKHDAFVAETFAAEGFIHCTHGETAVLEVANCYYQDDPRSFVLLEIEPSRVTARVMYEDDSGLYPHVYGAVDREAIVRLRRVERDADGRFLAIGHAHERGSV